MYKKKTPWRQVTITDGIVNMKPTSDEGLRALTELLSTGAVMGYWICTREELWERKLISLSDMGLSKDEIDWRRFLCT